MILIRELSHRVLFGRPRLFGLALGLAGCATSFGQIGQIHTLRTPGDFNRNGTADLAIGVPYHNVSGKIDAGEVHIMYTASCCGLMSESNLVLRAGAYGISGTPATSERFGAALAIGDFDGDDYYDLAIGAPGRAVSSWSNAGAVVVVYGSGGGLNSRRTSTVTQDTYGINGSDAEPNDEFGTALAAGDFNHDGYDDLLIGTPREDFSGFTNAGMVHALYGTSSGLSATNSQYWVQGDNLAGDADDYDEFGSALAAGDFDNDGYDDAAIGVPGDLANGAGAVNILFGSSAKLTADGNVRFHRDVTGMNETADSGDEFGSSLAVGDFNGDDADDLAIGAYGDTLPNPHANDGGSGLADYGLENAGSVSVLYGVEGVGLSVTDADGAATDQVWTQQSGIGGGTEANDWFGYALTVGDFDGDGYDDLVVGAPGESVGELAAAGALNVIYGRSAGGLNSSGNQIWYQDTANIAGESESGDLFGWALAAADFDGDGHDDLVSGVPEEGVNGVSDAGAVNVIYGMWDSTGGLDDDGNACWHRADAGMGSLQSGAKFGWVLAARR